MSTSLSPTAQRVLASLQLHNEANVRHCIAQFPPEQQARLEEALGEALAFLAEERAREDRERQQRENCRQAGDNVVVLFDHCNRDLHSR